MFKRVLGSLIIGVTTVAGGATAQDSLFESVEGWDILINPDLKGCLIEKRSDEGYRYQVGIDGHEQLSYVGLFAPAEAGLAVLDSQIWHVNLDGRRFKGQDLREAEGELQGGYMYFGSAAVISELATTEEFVLVAESGKEHPVEITGVNSAMRRMIECHLEQQ